MSGCERRPGRAAAGRYEYGAVGLRGRTAKGDDGIIARFLAGWGLTPAQAARQAVLAMAVVALALGMVWALGESYHAGYAAGVEWGSR